MDGKRIRYSTREAQTALRIGNSKFWNEVKAGRIAVYYDGNKGYCTPETLTKYDQACQANTVGPLKQSDKLKQRSA